MPGLIDSVQRMGASLKYWVKPRDIRMQIALLMSRDPSTLYRLLGDDLIDSKDEGFVDPAKPLWLNFGYWKAAKTYPDACAALARMLADAAEFSAEDTVLDAGFGYGEQDLLWVQSHGVRRIIGFNITPLHVEVAQRRVEERGLSDRIDLRLGSATDIALEAASVDKVVALESAFHFDTREQFMKEAFRVLRPGGRFAAADMIPLPGEADDGFYNRLVWKIWAIPPENVYDRNVYCEKLEALGFVDVKAESIRNYVFPGISRYRELRRQGQSMQEVRIELSEEDIAECRGAEFWAKNSGLADYVLISARKPA